MMFKLGFRCLGNRNLLLRSMSRRLDWDALRGFLLIMMAINHIPSPLDRYTNSPWGFITNAELFVFLSAFLAGIVFTKCLETKGPAAFRRKVLGRARTVYLYHMTSVVVILALAWFFLGDLVPFRNNTWFFLDHPVKGALAAATLVWQPAVLDILPLYIVMLLLTGPVLMAARRWGWWPVMTCSVALWVWSWPILVEPIAPYFHLKTRLLNLLGLQPPLNFGMFNDLSWQVLWVSALMCGSFYYHHRENLIRLPRPLIALAGALALVGFVVKHQGFGIQIDLGDWWWLLGKWNIGPLRLLNLACLIILYVAVSDRLRALGNLTPLVRLGQNSIGVFTFHTILVLPAVAYIEVLRIGGVGQILIVIAVLVAMYGFTFVQPWLGISWSRLQTVRHARLNPLPPARGSDSVPPAP